VYKDKLSLISDSDFIEAEKTSAENYIAVAAKDFDKYEEFVQAKVNTLTDTIACVFSHSSVAEDRAIFDTMQIKWVYSFWKTKKEKASNPKN